MTHRLQQLELDRGDLASAVAAATRGERVDASRLHISTPQLEHLLSALPAAPSGGVHLQGWAFKNTSFGAGAAFENCQFNGVSFHGAHFGNGCSFQGSRFSRAHFAGAVFGANANFSDVDFGTKATFHSAVFGDGARFARARFGASQFFAASFGSQTSFRAATFRARPKFGRARFGARGNFTSVTFPANADFGGAVFGDKFQIINAIFHGDPSFIGASFGDRARLTGWHVTGSLIMQSTRFRGGMSLHGAQLDGDLVFEHAGFDGSADLGDVEIGGSARLSGARFSGADRVGPLFVSGDLALCDALVERSCVIEVAASLIDLSRARLLGPVRLVVGRGDVLLDSTDSASHLVVTTPPRDQVQGRARVVSVRQMDLAGVVVSGLDVRALRFRGAENIDQLRLEAGARFESAARPAVAPREVIAEEHHWRRSTTGDASWYPSTCQPRPDVPAEVPDTAELARVYRGLRKAREDAKDAPGASDFYYGEMEMRRSEEWTRLRGSQRVGRRLRSAGEGILLELYRLGGGYGVRPIRPMVAFCMLVAIGGAAAAEWDFVVHREANAERGPHQSELTLEESVVFIIRSALLLPAPSGTSLTFGGDVTQILARIIGPLLIGLVALGLRARVKR